MVEKWPIRLLSEMGSSPSNCLFKNNVHNEVMDILYGIFFNFKLYCLFSVQFCIKTFKMTDKVYC